MILIDRKDSLPTSKQLPSQKATTSTKTGGSKTGDQSSSESSLQEVDNDDGFVTIQSKKTKKNS